MPDSVLNPQATRRNRENSSIGALPDEVLLDIFDFCRTGPVDRSIAWPKIWRNLVHVCQRWRSVVFSSPLRLDLRIYCSDKTPARKMLDIWPPFPIEILSTDFDHGPGDNTIAALEHHDRVSKIIIGLPYSECERLVKVMQKPFSALTGLFLVSTNEHDHVARLPDTFLGGSAPCLRSLSLAAISFPSLPRLLSSCSDLLELELRDIPNDGFILPEEMATALSTLTRLVFLCIEFEKPQWIIRRPPPLIRTILPALTRLEFRGTYEYLEDLLAPIDTPQLEGLTITFDQDESFDIFFDIQQIISHSRTLGPFDRAEVIFRDSRVDIDLHPPKGTDPYKMLELGVVEDLPNLQVSSMAEICSHSSSILSSVTDLTIGSDTSFEEPDDLEGLMGHSDWPELFEPFTAVRTLRLSGKIQPCVISSLRGHTGEGVAELLPELQNIYLYQRYWQDELEERQAIEGFITARQHSGHPVTIYYIPYHSDDA